MHVIKGMLPKGNRSKQIKQIKHIRNTVMQDCNPRTSWLHPWAILWKSWWADKASFSIGIAAKSAGRFGSSRETLATHIQMDGWLRWLTSPITAWNDPLAQNLRVDKTCNSTNIGECRRVSRINSSHKISRKWLLLSKIEIALEIHLHRIQKG